jgi:hypothetical protein
MKNVNIPGVDQQALIRQLQTAQQLQQAQAPEGQMVGRFHVAPSVTQRLATILRQTTGDRMGQQATAQMAAAEQARREALMRALNPQAQQPQQQMAPPSQVQPNVDALMNQQSMQGPQVNSVRAPQLDAQPIDQPRLPEPNRDLLKKADAMIEFGAMYGDQNMLQQGMALRQQEMQYVRTRGDQIADKVDQRGYQGQVRKEERGYRVEDRDMGFTHAEQLAKNAQDAAMGRQTNQQQFTAGQNSQNRALESEKIAATNALKTATTEAAQKKAQSELAVATRKEIVALDETKNLKAVIPVQRSAQDAMQRPTALSDMNMIYAMAKIFDPNSVVREGEYASVNASQNPADRLQGFLSFIQGGGRITPDHRKRLMDEINSRAFEAKNAYQTALQPYQYQVQTYQLDPKVVFPSFDELAGPGYQSSPGQPQAQPQAQPQGGQVLRFDAQGNPVQ